MFQQTWETITGEDIPRSVASNLLTLEWTARQVQDAMRLAGLRGYRFPDDSFLT